MVELYNKNTGKYLGKIEEEDLRFLIDNLEEENITDRDYYLTAETLDYLREKGMNEELEQVLVSALGTEESVEILYEKEDSL